MRDRRGLPLVDKQGYIKVETVNTLSFDELQNWIGAVLHGEDLGAGGDKEDLPYWFLNRVYHQLSPHVRETFEDVILIHLSDLAMNPETAWQDESADELLLLIGAVFRDSHRSRAPVDFLRYMIEQGSFRLIQGSNLHWRVLQTLVSIRHRGNPNFWKMQFQIFGDRFAMPTLAGLSLISLSEALIWVKIEGGKEAVYNAFLNRLPWLVEEYGAGKVEEYLLIYNLESILTESRKDEFLKFEDILGIKLMNTQLKTFLTSTISNKGSYEILKLDYMSMTEGRDFKIELQAVGVN